MNQSGTFNSKQKKKPRHRKRRSRRKTQTKQPTSHIAEMQCSPHCPYFYNNGDYVDWEYNKDTCLKVRKNPKPFLCDYDGHDIKSWYDKCPMKEEQAKKNKN